MDSKQKSASKSFDIKFQKIMTLFRFIEMFLFLIMVSRFSSQLPFAVKVSSDYFKGVTFTIFNPKFVFVIGNMIILILFFLGGVESNDRDIYDDLCHDYVKMCGMNVVSCANVSSKEKISRSKSDNKLRVNVSSKEVCDAVKKCDMNVVSCTNVSSKKKINRSKSDNKLRVKCKDDETLRELRRCVTQISSDTKVIKKSNVKEELSSDDFRRTVEAFIARQQKILRDEEFSPIVYIGS